MTAYNYTCSGNKKEKNYGNDDSSIHLDYHVHGKERAGEYILAKETLAGSKDATTGKQK